MRTRLPPRLTQFSFPRSKLAIALLCCTFSIEPSFAQEVDWAYNGADVNNSRFQSIDQINPSNVSQLKLAWSFSGDTTEAASAEATPLVVDGVMYISGNNDGVFALNPTTGKQIWHYAAPADAGYGTRGVAYGQGLIFSGQGANLVALNAKTGALVWKTQVDPHGNISAAPQFILAGGKVPEVLTGMNTPVGAGSLGLGGHVDAYNPATGKLLWRFYTLDPNTWPTNTIQGGGMWNTPTFDPTLNMVYFNVGNPGDASLGVNREGANLYSDSMVALDATTGELQWFFQMVHHDLWDFDACQPVMLFSWNGIPAIHGTTKAGYDFILDRASGESLFPYQEVAVPPTPAAVAAYAHPWPTQPVSSIESLARFTVDPASVPPGAVAVPEFTPPSPTAQVYQPGFVAGYEWFPAAYSPRTNMIYSPAIYHPELAVLDEYADPVAACATVNADECGLLGSGFLSTPGVDSGVYGAINTLTGKVAWSIPLLTDTPTSGMTVAGDLVFFADGSGIVYGVSASTGEILWVYDSLTVPGAGAPDSTGPAVYEVGGVEYVAMEFGGGSLLVDVAGGEPIKGNVLIAFALPSAVAAAADKTAASRGRVK
jgi:quinohemoprotein ethanol dehydrogenase